MKKFPVALQLYSVRDFLSNDFEGTIQKIKDMGYDGVEFAGTYGKTAEEVKSICQKIGVTAISAHVAFNEMMQDPENIMKYYSEIGCKYIVIPYLTEEYRPGSPKFNEVIEGAKVLGEAAKKHGMKLLYHNHDFEFKKIDGEYALDILYNKVSADLLQTELDTCWVNVGGENPTEYVKKYAGRAPVLHLKDFIGQKSDKMYALIGLDDTNDTKNTAVAFEFRPVGQGLQDFVSILNAAKYAETEWIVVEQDSPSCGNTSMECAKMSIDYLKTINK